MPKKHQPRHAPANSGRAQPAAEPWPLRRLGLALVASVAVCAAGVALLGVVSSRLPEAPSEPVITADQTQRWEPAARWFLSGCAVLFGAVVGSFLNVVIYRLPRGKSLSQPPSSCPHCGRRILWRDNVPVLGWLLLRGKCRHCGHGISPRYPLVELTAAAIAGLLAVLEFAIPGSNLPLSAAAVIPDRGLLLLVVAHAALLYTLLAAALMEYDGYPAPPRLFLPCLVLGILLPLRPAAVETHLLGIEPLLAAQAANLLLSLALAGGLGIVLMPVVGRRLFGQARLPSVPWSLWCLGAVLGWPVVLWAAPLGLVGALMPGAPLKRASWTAWVALASVPGIANLWRFW